MYQLPDSYSKTDETVRKATASMFVRLADDGESAIGVFRGEPLARKTHWVDRNVVDCTGPDCDECAHGDRAKVRVSLNFYRPDLGAMAIYELSGASWRDLLTVLQKYGLDAVYDIRRIGRKGDSDTRYQYLFERALTPEEASAIDAVPLRDLRAAYHLPPVAKPAPSDGEDKVPF
jgi:hypothetical protein